MLIMLMVAIPIVCDITITMAKWEWTCLMNKKLLEYIPSSLVLYYCYQKYFHFHNHMKKERGKNPGAGKGIGPGAGKEGEEELGKA